MDGQPAFLPFAREGHRDAKGVCEDVILSLGAAAAMIGPFQERFQCFSPKSLSSYACEDAELCPGSVWPLVCLFISPLSFLGAVQLSVFVRYVLCLMITFSLQCRE